MPSALPRPVRREIVERREAGESFASIARRMTVSYGAVRNIYRRYVETGELAPAYDRCIHTGVRSDKAVYAAAVEMKADHPSWGAGLIRVELSDGFDEERLPSVRTLQRWFRRAGVQTPKPETAPKATVRRGQNVHEVWALDAKEQIPLADGSRVSWLTITDEASGAILSVTLFPHRPLDECQSNRGEGSYSDDDDPMGTP